MTILMLRLTIMLLLSSPLGALPVLAQARFYALPEDSLRVEAVLTAPASSAAPKSVPWAQLQTEVTMRDHVVPWTIEGAITGASTGLLLGILGSVMGGNNHALFLGPLAGATFGAGIGALWGVLEHHLGLPLPLGHR